MMAVFSSAILALSAAVASQATPLNFMVMGDWGGSEITPFTTPAEVKVAAAMDATAAKLGASFSLALGDNFYSHGVVDVNDPRFQETFENVFTGKTITRYQVLSGNHDHYGNASAEVAYSSHSERWVYPSFWYTFTETAPDGTTVQIVMIDTVILAGNSLVRDDAGNLKDLNGDELPGPEDAAAADDQWSWIEQTLAASTADFVIVAGHYPIYSICEHGPTDLLVSKLDPIVRQYNVSAVLAGHDHCAEAFLYEGLQYHGIGAAHSVDSSTAHSSAVPSGSLLFHWAGDLPVSSESHGAYASISASKEAGLVVTHFKDDGTMLYTAPPVHPRN